MLSAIGTPPREVVEEALRMSRLRAELLLPPDMAEHMARLLGQPGRPATIHSTAVASRGAFEPCAVADGLR